MLWVLSLEIQKHSILVIVSCWNEWTSTFQRGILRGPCCVIENNKKLDGSDLWDAKRLYER